MKTSVHRIYSERSFCFELDPKGEDLLGVTDRGLFSLVVAISTGTWKTESWPGGGLEASVRWFKFRESGISAISAGSGHYLVVV